MALYKLEKMSPLGKPQNISSQQITQTASCAWTKGTFSYCSCDSFPPWMAA